MAPILADYLTRFQHAVHITTDDGSIELQDIIHRTDRRVVAAKDFKPGDVIFVESTFLSTEHQVAQAYAPHNCPPESVPVLPLDWQRLLYVWIHVLSDLSDPDHKMAILMKEMLSLDGVFSELAQKNDELRISDYQEDAKKFRERLKKKQKQKKTKLGLPLTEEIVDMIAKIETNCHELENDDKIGPETAESDDCSDSKCAVFLLASLMQHACSPNAHIKLNFSDGKTIATVSAVRNITAGQDITISYTDQEYFPTVLRRERLLRRGFLCMCNTCIRPDVTLAQIDADGRKVIFPGTDGDVKLRLLEDLDDESFDCLEKDVVEVVRFFHIHSDDLAQKLIQGAHHEDNDFLTKISSKTFPFHFEIRNFVHEALFTSPCLLPPIETDSGEIITRDEVHASCLLYLISCIRFVDLNRHGSDVETISLDFRQYVIELSKIISTGNLFPDSSISEPLKEWCSTERNRLDHLYGRK